MQFGNALQVVLEKQDNEAMTLLLQKQQQQVRLQRPVKYRKITSVSCTAVVKLHWLRKPAWKLSGIIINN